MERRVFLKFAGLLGAVETIALGTQQASAGTWTKVGNPTGATPGTWQKLSTPQAKIAAIAASNCNDQYNSFSMALRSDGRIYGAGRNLLGNLGINSTVSSVRAFTGAANFSNAVAVAGGQSHSVALRADGTVWACGYNGFGGTLGINVSDGTGRSTFVSSIGISGATQVAAGWGTSAVLRSDGTVWACGYNGYGVLGDNTLNNRLTYVSSIGISNAVAISLGKNDSALALRADGAVYACGLNDKGQLGDNSTTSRHTFVSAIGISNAVAVSNGHQHSVALRVDGTVWATGSNLNGRLGDNTTVSKSTYVSAIGISNAIAVSAGGVFSLALRADGRVFACGLNDHGQLGDNTGVSKNTYVSAIGISNAIAVSAGYNFGMALRADGQIFFCGYNTFGWFGDTTINERSTYVQATTV